MVGLGEFIKDYRRQEQSRQYARDIAQVIWAVTAPFIPGDINLVLEEWGPGGRSRLHVQPKNWPTLGTVVDISELDFVAWPEAAQAAVAELVAEEFRNIPYIEPDPSITLGEN